MYGHATALAVGDIWVDFNGVIHLTGEAGGIAGQGSDYDPWGLTLGHWV